MTAYRISDPEAKKMHVRAAKDLPNPGRGCTKRPALIVTSLFAILVAGCGPRQFTSNLRAETTYPPAVAATAIPILPVTDLTIVSASINGTPGFRFLIDTGAAATALFETPRTSALNLTTNGTFKVGGAGDGRTAQASFAEPLTLRIGEAEIIGIEPLFFTVDATPLFPSKETAFIDGVIGYDLMTRFAIDVDPDAGVVRLLARDDLETLDGDSGYRQTPIQKRGRLIYAKAMISVLPGSLPFEADLVVDSGARTHLLLIGGTHPSIEPPAGARSNSGIGIAGIESHLRGKVSSLAFGSVDFENIPATFSSSKVTGSGRHGLLGNLVLNRFRHVVDLEGGRLLLKPASKANQPAQINRFVGLAAIGDDFDKFVVLIAPEHVEAAGIKRGDIIVSIAGFPAFDLARDKSLLSEILSGGAGETIEVCLEAPAPDCRKVMLEAEF